MRVKKQDYVLWHAENSMQTLKTTGGIGETLITINQELWEKSQFYQYELVILPWSTICLIRLTVIRHDIKRSNE